MKKTTNPIILSFLVFISFLCFIQISFVVLDLTGNEYLCKKLEGAIKGILF